jgi:hypothetical protein
VKRTTAARHPSKQSQVIRQYSVFIPGMKDIARNIRVRFA